MLVCISAIRFCSGNLLAIELFGYFSPNSIRLVLLVTVLYNTDDSIFSFAFVLAVARLNAAFCCCLRNM